MKGQLGGLGIIAIVAVFGFASLAAVVPSHSEGLEGMAFTETQLGNAAALGLFPFGDALVDPTQIAGIRPAPSGAPGVIVVFRGGGGAVHDPSLSIDDALAGLESALAAAQAAAAGQ